LIQQTNQFELLTR